MYLQDFKQTMFVLLKGPILALQRAPHKKLAELLGENSWNAEKFERKQVLIKYPPASSATKLCHALQFH